MKHLSYFVAMIILAALMVAAWTIAAGGAEKQTSAARGKAYAESMCAACHAVGATIRSPLPEAPPFSTIANTPGMTAIALNAWLHTSHPTMPNFVIDPARIDDLAAYIVTLKTAPKPP